ncbi:hypothetical protein BJX61DRAFT_540669 [Aspergillus egyptiacus]|nr:hypothetical protein BJX61DRAFT_540669 [Aspergillus egyptiacus]
MDEHVDNVQALLAWVNALNPEDRPIQTTEALSTGAILGKVLHDIDPEHFDDVEEDPEDFDPERNLTQVHGQLVRYLKQKLEKWPTELHSKLDLQKFVDEDSAEDAERLLKLVLFATLTALEAKGANEPYKALDKLDDASKGRVLKIIETAETGTLNEQAQEDRDALHKEELQSQLLREISNLEQANRILAEDDARKDRRIAELEREVKQNERDLDFKDQRIDFLTAGLGGGHVKKGLKSSEEEEAIETLEAKLSAMEEAYETLEKEASSLRLDLRTYQQLRDEHDILKKEREALRHEVEAGRKYRQKLEELQGSERENQSLKKEIEQLREQILKNDAETMKLNGKLHECEDALARSEQQCNDIYNRRKELEADNEELKKRVDTYEDQIHQLESRLSEQDGTDYEYKGSSRSPTPTTGTLTPNVRANLQKDLEAVGFGDSTLSLGDEEKHSVVDGGVEKHGEELDGIVDERALAMQEEEKARMMEDMLKPLEEAKRKLATFVQEHTGDGADALQRSLEDLTKQISEMVEKDHERLAQRAQVSSYPRKLLPLQNVHWTQSVSSSSERCVEGYSDEEESRSGESTDGASTSLTPRSSTPSSSGLLSGPSPSDNPSFGDRVSMHFRGLTVNITIDDPISIDYIHQQNEQIKLLRDRISELEKSAEDGATDGEEEVISKERELELQKQIESLNRELALMSSSWYELQGKLHSTNNVPVSRYRHGSTNLVDAQKGWLARQRTAVAGR